MKHIKFLILAVGLFGLCTFYACSEDEPIVEEDQLEQSRQQILVTLAETPWEPSAVLRDGIETSDYEGFQLQLSDGAFQTVNGGQAWPESGTWQFVEGQSNQLIRDDGVLMTVEVKGENVEISFTFTEEVFSGGRAKTVQTFIAFILKKFDGIFG